MCKSFLGRCTLPLQTSSPPFSFPPASIAQRRVAETSLQLQKTWPQIVISAEFCHRATTMHHTSYYEENSTPVKTSTPVMRLSPTHILHCQLHWQRTRQEVKQVRRHWETGAGPSSRETDPHLKPNAVITGMFCGTHLQTTGSFPAQVGCSLTSSAVHSLGSITQGQKTLTDIRGLVAAAPR